MSRQAVIVRTIKRQKEAVVTSPSFSLFLPSFGIACAAVLGNKAHDKKWASQKNAKNNGTTNDYFQRARQCNFFLSLDSVARRNDGEKLSLIKNYGAQKVCTLEWGEQWFLSIRLLDKLFRAQPSLSPLWIEPNIALQVFLD